MKSIRGDRVKVGLDDRRTLTLDARVVAELALRVGDPVDAALEARLLDAELRSRARTAALRLLDTRPRSRRELAGRLRRKDFPPAVVSACLDEMEHAGWLDDAAFARSLVRDRLRLRPRGPGRMAQELRARGVADEVASAAVAEVFAEEEVVVPELAADVARGWVRRQGPAIRAALGAGGFTPEAQRARRRLHGYLARRGFTGALARTVLEVVQNEVRTGD